MADSKTDEWPRRIFYSSADPRKEVVTATYGGLAARGMTHGDWRDMLHGGVKLYIHLTQDPDVDHQAIFQLLREGLERAGQSTTGSCAVLEAQAWMNQGQVPETELYLDMRTVTNWLRSDPNHPVDDLAGAVNLLERSAFGATRHRDHVQYMGLRLNPEEALQFRVIPAPWNFTDLLVAEALDRAVSGSEDEMAAANEHFHHALEAISAQKAFQRLLSPPPQ